MSKLFAAATRNHSERTPAGPVTILPGSELRISIGHAGSPSEPEYGIINPSTLRGWVRRGWVCDAGTDGAHHYLLTQAGYKIA